MGLSRSVMEFMPGAGVPGFLEASISDRWLGDRSLLRVVSRGGLLEAFGGRGPAGQQMQGVL
jgi:hypothetical protein